MHKNVSSIGLLYNFRFTRVLIIVIYIAGIVFETQSVVDEVVRQIRSLLGQESASTLQTVIERVRTQTSNVTLPTALGVGVILFGSTGAFAGLQTNLNAIWGGKAKSKTRRCIPFYYSTDAFIWHGSEHRLYVTCLADYQYSDKRLESAVEYLLV